MAKMRLTHVLITSQSVKKGSKYTREVVKSLYVLEITEVTKEHSSDLELIKSMQAVYEVLTPI